MVSRVTAQTGLTGSSSKGERNEGEDRTSENELESAGKQLSDGTPAREPTKSRLDRVNELEASDLQMWEAISSSSVRKIIQRRNKAGRRGRPEADDTLLLREMAKIRRSQPNLDVLPVATRVVDALPVVGDGASGSPQLKVGDRTVTKEHFPKHLADKYKAYEPELMRALDDYERGRSVGEALLFWLKNGYFPPTGGSGSQQARNRSTLKNATGNVITPAAVDGVLDALGWYSREFFRHLDFPGEGEVPRQRRPKHVSKQTTAQVLEKIVARKSRFASSGVLGFQPLPVSATVISPDDLAGYLKKMSDK